MHPRHMVSCIKRVHSKVCRILGVREAFASPLGYRRNYGSRTSATIGARPLDAPCSLDTLCRTPNRFPVDRVPGCNQLLRCLRQHNQHLKSFGSEHRRHPSCKVVQFGFAQCPGYRLPTRGSLALTREHCDQHFPAARFPKTRQRSFVPEWSSHIDSLGQPNQTRSSKQVSQLQSRRQWPQ
jgi:hypothetical protein